MAFFFFELDWKYISSHLRLMIMLIMKNCSELCQPDIVWRIEPSGSCQTLTVQMSAVTASFDRRQTAVTGHECPDRVTAALVELLLLLEIVLTDQSLALLSSDPDRIWPLWTDTHLTLDTCPYNLHGFIWISISDLPEGRWCPWQIHRYQCGKLWYCSPDYKIQSGYCKPLSLWQASSVFLSQICISSHYHWPR